MRVSVADDIDVSLLTGGADRPYVFGLANALISAGIALDLVGSDDLDCPEFDGKPRVRFLNLRGSQNPTASIFTKILRVSAYYLRLLGYSTATESRLFHIVWNNKFEFLDRTLLMLYYKLLGKKVAFTVHNVNAGRRDCNDGYINRLTLRVQYRFADHLFVHTQKMKQELLKDFGIHTAKVTVIPFGINNAVPNTDLTKADARRRLSIADGERVVLFFGNITPYKGIEHLTAAFRKVLQGSRFRLIIAGRPDNCDSYWRAIREDVSDEVKKGQILLRDEFVPDDETEIYFKAADVFVLPYKHIYQSGVLFLGYSFGLPVLAADVGSLTEDIVEGQTGFAFRPEDPIDLARAIEQYFASDLYANLEQRKQQIREYSLKRHSWETVAKITMSVYEQLLGRTYPHSLNLTESIASVNGKSLPQDVNADSGTHQVSC